MDGNLAKKLFARLIKNTKKPDSGPVSLSAEDAKSLSDVAKEIIRRDTEGIRARWGPRLPELNDLSKIILTDEQWLKKGRPFFNHCSSVKIILLKSFNSGKRGPQRARMPSVSLRMISLATSLKLLASSADKETGPESGFFVFLIKRAKSFLAKLPSMLKCCSKTVGESARKNYYLQKRCQLPFVFQPLKKPQQKSVKQQKNYRIIVSSTLYGSSMAMLEVGWFKRSQRYLRFGDPEGIVKDMQAVVNWQACNCFHDYS